MVKRNILRKGKIECSWLSAIPLVIFFFAAAVIYWSGIGFSGFVGSLVIPISLFLIVPLLNYVGIDKKATNWFIRAGLISILIVIANLVPFILSPSVWIVFVIDVAYILTIIAVIIGIIMSLIKLKNY